MFPDRVDILLHGSNCVREGVCKGTRARVCVCVCVREGEREREREKRGRVLTIEGDVRRTKMMKACDFGVME